MADDKFWNKVDKKSNNECWIWLGAKKPTGYGNLRVNKVYTSAHRQAWVLTYGPIPKNMQVQHACDNPSCCNPRHLMLGTHLSNYIDMDRKGRANIHHFKANGERNGNSKLSAASVGAIRLMHLKGIKQTQIAKVFDVHKHTVNLIVNNKARVYG